MTLLQAQQQQKVQVGGGSANGVGSSSSICRKVQTSVVHGITSNSTTLFVPSLTHHHHHLCRTGDDPVTLDLFHPKLSSIPVELEEPYPLPFGWQRFLHLKTGSIYYKQEINRGKMSRNGANSKLDLRLNLSPPRRVVGHVQAVESSPNRSAASSPTSSCVSSEETEAETSMLLVGCPRCLMYVMLSEEDPRCPKCKSTVLLDFLHQQNNTNINNDNNNNNNNNNNKASKKN